MHRVEDISRREDVRQRHQLLKPFVLADALKNPGVLVKAWNLLGYAAAKTPDCLLLAHTDPTPVVIEARSSRLRAVVSAPSNDDLMTLYSMAEAFIFPSWIEGFGLPLLKP
jgi:glycosyltransferase involved in cell wall biosynthesis